MTTKRKQEMFEVQVDSAWISVDERTWRAWPGKRRTNGKDYYGPVFYFGTNEKLSEADRRHHSRCQYPVRKEVTGADVRRMMTQKTNFLSLEHDVPLGLIRGMMASAGVLIRLHRLHDELDDKEDETGVQVLGNLISIFETDQVRRAKAIAGAYHETWSAIASLLQIPEAKIDRLMAVVWETMEKILSPTAFDPNELPAALREALLRSHTVRTVARKHGGHHEDR